MNFLEKLIIDPESEYLLKAHTWRLDSKGYAVTNYNGSSVRLHRFIVPEYKIADHKNRNKLDNRKINLREATPQQNILNRGPSSRNKTGYKGVTCVNNLYRAAICIDGFQRFIGSFVTAIAAAKAYDTQAKIHHKEFAYLNFPENSDD